MPFELILFDADDTLFDFRRAEAHALEHTLLKHRMSFNDLIYSDYQNISQNLWELVEQQKISVHFLKQERFRALLSKHNWQGDSERMGHDYLQTLALQGFLVEGALEICQQLQARSRLAIVTNGVDFVQKKRLSASPLRDLMSLMVVSEECGFPKPDARIFHYALAKAQQTNVERVLMVGDRLETDILGAKNSGIASCWYNPNKKENRTNIQPDFEIHSLHELLSLGENLQ